MGIRETINRNSAISAVFVVSALVIVSGVIVWELRGNNGKPPAECYYTTDNGQTWFVDSSSKLAPFDHDGAPAVRCYVFKCSSGKFAGLLEKYSDDTRAQLVRMMSAVPPVPLRDPPPVLVKKPSEKDWVGISTDKEAMILMHDITGPDGSPAERIMP